METANGLKSFLRVSRLYEQFQDLAGTRNLRRWLADRYCRFEGAEKVVDMGCGPGGMLDYLPRGINYVGFDLNEKYIKTARQAYGARGTFLVGSATEFFQNPDPHLNNADLVLCIGLLHHLDDNEVIRALELSKSIINPAGRLVCIEPTFLIHQRRFSKWMMSKDRGQHVREEHMWKDLVSKVFNTFSTNIATGLITRVPYIHIVIECSKGSPSPDGA